MDAQDNGKLTHRLMRQLLAAPDVTEHEMAELYEDLKQIYEEPFMALISQAVEAGAVYVEPPGSLPN